MTVGVRFCCGEDTEPALVENGRNLFKALLDRHGILHALAIDTRPIEMERLFSNGP
jgi:hypothetical protein